MTEKQTEIQLELLTEENLSFVRQIDRSDVPIAYVDDVATLWELTQYGTEHQLAGCTFAVKHEGQYVGALLLGEALPWETDPEEMKQQPFWRLMGFVIDKACRGQGLGGKTLEMAINAVYERFGVRPIALGCHEENTRAITFYERHGFKRTQAMEGRDIYFLRYPHQERDSTFRR